MNYKIVWLSTKPLFSIYYYFDSLFFSLYFFLGSNYEIPWFYLPEKTTLQHFKIKTNVNEHRIFFSSTIGNILYFYSIEKFYTFIFCDFFFTLNMSILNTIEAWTVIGSISSETLPKHMHYTDMNLVVYLWDWNSLDLISIAKFPQFFVQLRYFKKCINFV